MTSLGPGHYLQLVAVLPSRSNLGAVAGFRISWVRWNMGTGSDAKGGGIIAGVGFLGGMVYSSVIGGCPNEWGIAVGGWLLDC